MSRRHIALLILAAASLTACGRAAATQPAAGGYRVFLEEGYGSGAEQITVRDSATGTIERQLPLGTASADWSRYYTVTQLTGSARLTALDPASGRTIAVATIPQGYELPNFGYVGPTAGLSPNGNWLTLTSHPSSGSATNFLVGASSLAQPFATVRVDGDYSFDALSNDGKSLYLIQKMSDAYHYQVRLYDLGSNRLNPQPVADKVVPIEPMQGIRGDRVANPNGSFVYTVYIRDSGPFIHALPLSLPIAFCVDLPKDAANDMAKQFFWSLAITPDGSTVYAANGSLGLIAEMTSGDVPKIVRSGHLALNPSNSPLAGIVTQADAKGSPIGGAALSKDGRTLFTLAGGGVLAIDTSSLKARSSILQNTNIESIRMSSDGNWLYAADAGASKLWQIDPVSGAVRGEVKGVSNPWALLWIAAR